MQLTEEEKRMLDGELGSGYQKAMEILVALGKIYGSEKMIPVKSAHISGNSYKGSGAAGLKFVTSLADTKNKFKIYTTLNPLSVDNENWRELGFLEEDFKNQMATVDAYRRMGCGFPYTCTPFLAGNLPRFGENIAWAESSALLFANSVIGARTNREGGISALASGLAGRTPLYGYHIDENRRATILIENMSNLKTTSDYSALGYHLGCLVEGEVPFLTHLNGRPTIEDLMAFSAGIATSGNTTLFHIQGVTPESQNPQLASKRNINRKIVVSDEDLKAVYHRLSGSTQSDIDYVGVGCPHLSIIGLSEIAAILGRKSRRVHPRVRFWVFTSSFVKEKSDRMGFSKTIIEAGGEIVCNTCVTSSSYEKFGFRNFATNSAKAAHYTPALAGLNPFFGSMEDCIEAAITGHWKGRG